MKKKFKDTKVGKFLVGKKGLFSKLGNALPDEGFLGILKNLIHSDDTLPPQDKETALKLLEMDLEEMRGVTERWSNDMISDSCQSAILYCLLHSIMMISNDLPISKYNNESYKR